jgi:hypothetical protein
MNTFFRPTLCLILSIFVLVGCHTKDDTLVIITVRDSTNQLVANAEVELFNEMTGIEEPNTIDPVTTNTSGEAIFNFNDVYQLGQAGVAIYNIDVKAGNISGHGVIKIEEETTSRETVFVAP